MVSVFWQPGGAGLFESGLEDMSMPAFDQARAIGNPKARALRYLKSVCHYVHLNPARAKLLKPDQPLRAFAWISWPRPSLPPATTLMR